MDKIKKFLLKLSQKERDIIILITQKILLWDFNGLYIKKLEWKENFFRVRKWRIRIIFFQVGKNIKIIDINYRGRIYK